MYSVHRTRPDKSAFIPLCRRRLCTRAGGVTLNPLRTTERHAETVALTGFNTISSRRVVITRRFWKIAILHPGGRLREITCSAQCFCGQYSQYPHPRLVADPLTVVRRWSLFLVKCILDDKSVISSRHPAAVRVWLHVLKVKPDN